VNIERIESEIKGGGDKMEISTPALENVESKLIVSEESMQVEPSSVQEVEPEIKMETL
jgi:hypothetical protein